MGWNIYLQLFAIHQVRNNKIQLGYRKPQDRYVGLKCQKHFKQL